MTTAKRAKPKPAAVRSITILGATGSIGSSTVDLLKRQPDRFRVAALTAHRNGVALAQLAREIEAEVNAGGGGCKPIPLGHRVQGDKLLIAESDVLKGWGLFR